MSAVTENKPELVNIEVDGVAMAVPKNSMIIEATDKAGIDVPRFCYHRKLKIAANCRMCLVDVEKAPKPLPACATPVTEGMKVYTRSRRAIDAQHSVMEFLLINHPLDCPICDQGGECELQDLAMGYGRSVSRFTERKRVVKDKNVGPLIQTDMTRCIHCTRCVRFLDEIAGTQEMGGTGRGDRMEIGTCIEHSIDSELSGNIIDMCPVGALTNKPFRFSARAWEMIAQPSVAAHDGVGSQLWYHTRRGDVMRAVPQEDDAANESWLSDRDRYSHFGLYADDRVLTPQVKQNGSWREVSWAEAIAAAADAMRDNGGDETGILMSPSASTEEYFLAARLAQALDCPNIDHRLRQRDFADEGHWRPAFQMPVEAMQTADQVLLVGSNIRHEAPILGHRLRQAWCAGGQIMAVSPLDWTFHFDLSQSVCAAPQEMVGEVAAIAKVVAGISGKNLPDALAKLVASAEAGERHQAIASALNEAGNGLVLLGQYAMQHQDSAWLRSLSAWVAEATGCRFNLLTDGANSAGAFRAGALPGPDGLNARSMLEQGRKTYVLWDMEPDFDTANPALCVAALKAAERVVAITGFADETLREVADVLLPLAPRAESEGSMITVDGRELSWRQAGRPRGDCKPGWKILRQLAAQLELDGFDQVSLADVHAQVAAIDEAAATAGAASLKPPKKAKGLYRIGEVPMYSVDALCRRSEPLQETRHAASHFAGLNPADAGRLKLADGEPVCVQQDEVMVTLPLRISGQVPEGAVWLRSATCEVRALGDSSGPIQVGREEAS